MDSADWPGTLPHGTRIGPVVLERPIAQGPYGIVYIGQHDYWGRVAVKEFFPSFYATRTAQCCMEATQSKWQDVVRAGLDCFVTDGRGLHAIRCENIAPVQDLLEQDGSAYLVMDFIEGESLKDALYRDAFSDPAAVVAVGAALIGALEVMHTKNILHRGIEPDNIMIRTDGGPVLIGFGGPGAAVQKAAHSTQNIIIDGYFPHEHYDTSDNPTFPIGPWTDIHSVAAILYRLVSGREPAVSQDRLRSLGIRSQGDPLVPLETLAPAGYPKSWLAAVDAALAVNPSARPQNAAAWQRMFATAPIQPQRTERAANVTVTPPPDGRFWREMRLAANVAFLYFLLLVPVLIVTMIRNPAIIVSSMRGWSGLADVIVAAFIIWRLPGTSGVSLRELGVRSIRTVDWVTIAIGSVAIAIVMLVETVANAAARIQLGSAGLHVHTIFSDNWPVVVTIVLSIVARELYFRMLLFRTLSKRMSWLLAAVLPWVLLSLFSLRVSGAVFFLGLVFGCAYALISAAAYRRSGNIFTSMIMNLLSSVAYVTWS